MNFATSSAIRSRLKPNALAAIWLLLATSIAFSATGCSLVPDARQRERFHNPLPQLHRIAVLPFFNQSSEPTLDQTQVAEAYYAELQAIPGFEVLPIGVATGAWERFVTLHGEPRGGADFQELARFIGVDAVVIGAVTDYDPYSPPRLAMTVRWYAANPAFHPVPAGYGLPWGTKAEKDIPARIVLETELEMARSQLAAADADPLPPSTLSPATLSPAALPPPSLLPPSAAAIGSGLDAGALEGESVGDAFAAGGDGYGVLEHPPIDPLPPPVVSTEPVLTHTRIYHGDDPDFTERLADYVYAMDDGRLTGWQSYLTRSDDFIRFCCRLHITEMLEMRGGRDKSDLILRWPISRYWR